LAVPASHDRARAHRAPSVITRADCAGMSGQWGLAERLYRKALHRNPRNPPIWVQYGHALKMGGKLDEAEGAYRRAIAVAPRIADSHLQLGHALKLQGKVEAAQTAYLRALVLDPSSRPAALELSAFGWSERHLAELKRRLVDARAQPLNAA
jgi:tetratricopeptide (TPR) repeat protein